MNMNDKKTPDTLKDALWSKDYVYRLFKRKYDMCTQQAHQTKNFDEKKWPFFAIFDNFQDNLSFFCFTCLPLLQCFENEKKAKNEASSTKNIFCYSKQNTYITTFSKMLE